MGLVAQHCKCLPSRPNSMPNRFHKHNGRRPLPLSSCKTNFWPAQISNANFRGGG
ncbi:unnamed protein product, partial [Amoebophrya sp. A120]